MYIKSHIYAYADKSVSLSPTQILLSIADHDNLNTIFKIYVWN